MLNTKIILRKKNKNDYGLFAIEDIVEGEFIWQAFEGDINKDKCLTIEEIKKLPNDQRNVFLHYCYQIDINLYSGYTNLIDVKSDPANYMNHSCDPNCWYEGDIIVARRKIRINEEICYDYATDSTGRDWGFQCGCGSKNCRGSVKKDDWKKLKSIYGNHFTSYILKKLL